MTPAGRVHPNTPPSSALQIFERHFQGLNAYDRYLDDLSFVEPRLKRFAQGLSSGQQLAMFQRELTHINYPTFRRLVEEMMSLGDVAILETGSSAYGTNSSALFAQLARALGGTFVTVDANPATAAGATELIAQLGCGGVARAVCAESVAFLRQHAARCNVVYLDSFDLVPDRFVESENHGWSEFKTLCERGLLDSRGALILVDDTPRTLEILATQVDDAYLAKAREHLVRHNRLPGKGALIAQRVASDQRFELLAWEYQILFRVRPEAGLR
jgi:hypothetical protein